MRKDELIEKVKKDLKVDKMMVWVSALICLSAYSGLFFGSIGLGVLIGVSVNLLTWANSVLLTKRSLQILEVTR